MNDPIQSAKFLLNTFDQIFDRLLFSHIYFLVFDSCTQAFQFFKLALLCLVKRRSADENHRRMLCLPGNFFGKNESQSTCASGDEIDTLLFPGNHHVFLGNFNFIPARNPAFAVLIANLFFRRAPNVVLKFLHHSFCVFDFNDLSDNFRILHLCRFQKTRESGKELFFRLQRNHDLD